jgi:uncharacterized membrane protein
MTERRYQELGQVALIVAVTIVGLLGVTALVVDGGLLFAARRNLQSLADGSARAGAMSLDENGLRESGDSLELDSSAAQQAATTYLNNSGFSGAVDVSVDSLSVQVRLSEVRPTLLLGLAGIRTIGTEASAVARPAIGTVREGS